MKKTSTFFYNHSVYILLLIVFFSSGCKKFVQVDPPVSSLAGTSVFTDDATATAAMLGIYSKLMENPAASIASGNVSISLLTGASADEQLIYAATPALVEFEKNSLLPTNASNQKIWSDLYAYIYSANSVIEGVSASNAVVSDRVKKQLTGEAKFMRAFLHFYLVNLYGPVPYNTTTNYAVNQVAGRMSAADVYTKIIGDLVEARNLLPDNYLFANNERTRPTKMAATALLARVYLYTGDWAKAELESSAIISNSTFALPALAQVFLKNSKEAIFQLESVLPGFSTGEGYAHIFTSKPTRVAMNPALATSFETGDNRKTAWTATKVFNNITYYQTFKYKERTISTTTAPTEYLMVLRLAEQYLVRAEARANLNNITGAKADVDVIRARAGLAGTTATDKATMLAAIEKERRMELFAEWGHRWLDLKRTQRADAVLGPLKGSNWQTTDQLYPIPQVDLDRDPMLKPQNAGY